MRRLARAAAATLCGATLLTACSEPDDRAQPGDLIAYDHSISGGAGSSIAIPVGTVDISATDCSTTSLTSMVWRTRYRRRRMAVGSSASSSTCALVVGEERYP